MVAMIVLSSLFAYAVVGIWSYRVLEARRQRNPKACHDCDTCAFRVLGAILWPAPMPILVSIASVVGMANLPRRISTWRAGRAKVLAPARITIPKGAALGSEEYRRLKPLIESFERGLPIHERE